MDILMMRHLGVTDLIEGDLLGWERAGRAEGWPKPAGRAAPVCDSPPAR